MLELIVALSEPDFNGISFVPLDLGAVLDNDHGQNDQNGVGHQNDDADCRLMTHGHIRQIEATDQGQNQHDPDRQDQRQRPEDALGTFYGHSPWYGLYGLLLRLCHAIEAHFHLRQCLHDRSHVH